VWILQGVTCNFSCKKKYKKKRVAGSSPKP
jgi:hypothetical protein